jgi:hypothetical protein
MENNDKNNKYRNIVYHIMFYLWATFLVYVFMELSCMYILGIDFITFLSEIGI